jgi:hypothetical protein
MPNEKEETESTDVSCLHADLKMLIAEKLIFNCSTRARNILTGSVASEKASWSMQNSESITTAAGENSCEPAEDACRVDEKGICKTENT